MIFFVHWKPCLENIGCVLLRDSVSRWSHLWRFRFCGSSISYCTWEAERVIPVWNLRRELAKDIEAMEMHATVGGPRTGSPRRLRSKIAGEIFIAIYSSSLLKWLLGCTNFGNPSLLLWLKSVLIYNIISCAGLKVMLEEAHNTCELQAIELYELRRDVRLTHARVTSYLNLS